MCMLACALVLTLAFPGVSLRVEDTGVEELGANRDLLSRRTLCDPKQFVAFDLQKIQKDAKKHGGKIRKEVHSLCTDRYDRRSTGGITKVEYYMLRTTCELGADIGQKICAQSNSTEEMAMMAPLEIINHFDWGEHPSLDEDWSKCHEKPKPTWTNFESCYHACQYLYPDCREWGRCERCQHRSDEEDCFGVRDDASQGWDEPPAYNHSFLSACASGCNLFVKRKVGDGGGEFCRKGDIIDMESSKTQQRFEKQCEDSDGRMLDSGVCLCDNPEEIKFKTNGVKYRAEIINVRDREDDPKHGLTHKLRFDHGTEWFRINESRKEITDEDGLTVPYETLHEESMCVGRDGKVHRASHGCQWKDRFEKSGFTSECSECRCN